MSCCLARSPRFTNDDSSVGVYQLVATPRNQFRDAQNAEVLGRERARWRFSCSSGGRNDKPSLPNTSCVRRARRADETADPFAEVGRRFELFTDGKLPGCHLCPVNLPRWLRTNDVLLTCSYAASSTRASLACSASLARRISTSPMPWPGRQSGTSWSATSRRHRSWPRSSAASPGAPVFARRLSARAPSTFSSGRPTPPPTPHQL